MSAVERTLLVIMPCAKAHEEAIIALVDSLGYFIVRQRELQFTPERAHQYFYSTKFTPFQLDHLCSAPVRCLLLSKVGAIASMMNVVGAQFDEPSDARDHAPQSLRALYGIDRARCGVRCSLSPEDAKREISCVFPSAPLHQRSTEDYLQETILPGLAEALAEISQTSPNDPFEKLERWLLRHRPASETVYENPVLKGHQLKADGGPDRTDSKLVGVRNFRRCSGAAPIYGVAQASVEGMENLAQQLLEVEGHTHVVFLNVREEPVVFVDGAPYTIRNPTRPFLNVQHFAAVQGFELGSIERRLASDVRGVAAAAGGSIKVLGVDGTPEAIRISNSTSVLGMTEAYDAIRKKYPAVSFQRVPYPSASSPDDGDMDDLIDAVRTLPKGGCLVMQCDSGKGRSTLFMAMAALVWSSLSGEWKETDAGGGNSSSRPPSASGPGAPRDATSFAAVQVLVSSLERSRGPLVQHVMRAVHSTTHIIHLSQCVGDALDASQNTNADNRLTKVQHHKGQDSSVWMQLATCYLRRFCLLLVLAAYLTDQSPHMKQSFRTWHRKHWSVEQPIRSIRFK